MIQTEATIIAKEIIAPAWWRLSLAAPALTPAVQPGQFLLLRCGDLFTCYLRRPVFPQPLEAPGQVSLLLRPNPDPGLAWLSSRKIGDTVDLIGPLGHGFDLPEGSYNLLLVADQPLIAPLLGLMAQALAGRALVTLALGGNRAANLYPPTALPPAVELQAATLDGSAGHRGAITDLLPELLRWADQVCVVGTRSLYRSLKAQTAEARLALKPGFLYGLITDPLLPCGLGACFGCTLETEAGLRLACLDGPVFDLAQLHLEEG
jgi:dihydroorotate dehydrogenase electron transfer subunit